MSDAILVVPIVFGVLLLLEHRFPLRRRELRWRCGEQLQFFTQFSTSNETEPLQDVRFFYQVPPYLQLESNSLTTTLPNTTVVSGGGGQDTSVDVRWSPHNLGSVQTIRYRAQVSCCPPVFSPPVYQSGTFIWFVDAVEAEVWPSMTAQQPPVAPGAPGAPSVTKDDGGITATPGSAITYVVVPTQSGTAQLADVVLTETVPDDTTFSAAGSAPRSSSPRRTSRSLRDAAARFASHLPPGADLWSTRARPRARHGSAGTDSS